MKVNIKLVNMPETPLDTPLQLRLAAQSVATSLAPLMRLHGIGSISGVPEQVGSRSILHKAFVPLPVEPPPLFQTTRGEVVSCLAAYMSLFGIISIDIVLDQAEQTEISEAWESVVRMAEQGIPRPKAGTDIDPKLGHVEFPK